MTGTDDTLPAIPNVSLGEPIGGGAFGRVYKGRHVALDVDVAVKIVKLPRAAGAAALERTLREARLMARLDHPNLLRIYDAGASGDGVYMVLELMSGGSLDGARALPAPDVERHGRELLAGLQALHDANVIHRDIKPANCLVRRGDGRVKLADMGIALERAAADDDALLAGTLFFMAPELFDSFPPPYSPRSDLYALGMTLLFLALPPEALSIGEDVGTWAREGARPDIRALRPDLAPGLSSLLLRMVAPRPEDRPESAAKALRALSEEGGGAPRPAGAPAASDAAAEGKRLGPWVLGAEIWANANWRVLAATHAKTGLPGRLSHLQPMGPLARATPMLTAAAERAAQLDHPGIATVYDWGLWNDRLYVVVGAHGRTLVDLVQASGALDEAPALRVAAAVADALAYMHAKDLVYQVLGLGSVNAGADAASVHLSWPLFCSKAGEPAFRRVVFPMDAAPEAFTLEGTIDPAADLYALGETLYQLLAGRHPYAGAPIDELAAAKAVPPKPLREQAPGITQPTAALVDALMANNPASRPTAAEARDRAALLARRLDAQTPAHAPPVAPVFPPVTKPRA